MDEVLGSHLCGPILLLTPYFHLLSLHLPQLILTITVSLTSFIPHKLISSNLLTISHLPPLKPPNFFRILYQHLPWFSPKLEVLIKKNPIWGPSDVFLGVLELWIFSFSKEEHRFFRLYSLNWLYGWWHCQEI